MLDEANPDLVVFFPGGIGTEDMKKRTTKAGIKMVVFYDEILRSSPPDLSGL
jgi:spore coat polysaccharide biosynthesis predicted glycosyltransferase SpsG